jgi:peptidyl-prolyl cis-trans isomerase D
MSVIQKIRDKYAALVIVLIAIALLGFILMDALVGRSGNGFFGGRDNTIGTVNGNSISYDELNAPMQFMEAFDDNNAIDEDRKQQERDRQWQILTYYNLIKDDAAKLGIEATKADVAQMLNNPMNPPTFLTSLFGSPQQNQNFPQQAGQFLNNIPKGLASIRDEIGKALKSGNIDKSKADRMLAALNDDNFYKANIEPLEKIALIQKYLGVVNKAAYVPKFMAEAVNAEGSQMVSMQYVQLPYAKISDSALGKITDAEIDAYVAQHKSLYTQDKNKLVYYTSFDAAPTVADSAALRTKLEGNRVAFDSATNLKTYLSLTGTTVPYANRYVTKAMLGLTNADQIIAAGAKASGPYVEGENYVMAKVAGVKTIPDSVRAKHILFNYQKYGADAQKTADSIANIVKANPALFDSLAKKFGTDGTAEKGGDLGFFALGAMVPEFADYCFGNPIGSKGVVKSQFGFHVVEITANKGSVAAYNVAQLATPIISSDATVSAVELEANKFVAAATSVAKFEEAIKASNGKLVKLTANVGPGENKLNNMPETRTLVTDFVHKSDAGKVSNPIKVGNKYYVLTVVANNKAGTMTAATARATVERILIDKKKAAQIKKEVGTVTTLEDLASKRGVTVVQADSVQLANAFIPGLNSEPIVVGAAFNKANINKVVGLIAGATGVYAIKPLAFSTKPVAGTVKDTRIGLQGEVGNQFGQMLEALRRKANIADNRDKIYR